MPQIPPIVDARWLADRWDEVVLADVRWYLDGRSALGAYRCGHIPGAVFVDLDRWLSGPPSPEEGRHPLPTPEHFAEGMSSAGVGDDDAVVAYDDAGGVVAARLVWMLRALGRSAALLDGGLAAWDGALEEREAQRERSRFTAAPWPPERVVAIDQVDTAASVVIDARPQARYRGEDDAVDPRAGHVPGAWSVPCREHLDPSGRLLSAGTLAGRFTGLGIADATPVVSYCGSGVTACHNLLVLEWLGLGDGRLFAGSWSQWSNDPERAVATGADPG